jgi:Cupredoxin-like domain
VGYFAARFGLVKLRYMKTIARNLALFLALLLPLALGSCGDSSTGAAPKVRIMLVAKDQAFHLEGKPELRNPSITLKQGEPAELVLRNDDPNHVLHCLSIGGLDVKIPSIDSGQSFTVTIRPNKRGTLTYACLMHPPMAGKLIVQ